MGRLGKHIQTLRQQRSMTLLALAETVGKTSGYLSRVEARDEIPSPELICLISDVLKERPETLLALAKSDVLQRTEEQIEKKSADALSLFRRSK